jgi:hypothetical protein
MSIPHRFYYIQSGESLRTIARDHFGLQSDPQISDCVQSLQRLNPHIRQPDRIFPGRILHLGNSSGFLAEVPAESDLLEMETVLGQDPAETGRILENWEVFQTVSEMSRSPLSENDFLPKYSGELGKSALEGANKIAKGEFGLIGVSPHQWRAMESEIVLGLNSQVRYLKNANGTLGLIPKDGRAFSIMGKTFVVKPDDSGGFARFSSRVKIGKSLAKRILGPAGKAIRVISWGMSGYNVYSDWGTSKQHQTLNRELVNTGLGLASSPIGMATAEAVCGRVIFASAPLGISCFLSAFIMGSLLASKGADFVSSSIPDNTAQYYERPFERDFVRSIIGH